MGTPLRAFLETSTASLGSWEPPLAPSRPAPSPRSGFTLPSCLLRAVGAVTSWWHGWCRGSPGGGQPRRGWGKGRGAVVLGTALGELCGVPGSGLEDARGPGSFPRKAQRRVPAGEGGTGKVARGGCGHPASPCPSRALVPPLEGAGAGAGCCTKRVLGAAPCGLPLLISRPSTGSPRHFPTFYPKFALEKKKIQPPKLSFSQLLVQGFAASELAGLARRR